jgi:hypothetical protein
MRMSSKGGRTSIRTAGIIAATALVVALFAGAARTAGAVQAIGHTAAPAAVAAVSADHQSHLAPPHRRWQHPWGTARDNLVIGLPLGGVALGLLAIAAVLRPRGAWGVPGVAVRNAVGRGPPALVA